MGKDPAGLPLSASRELIGRDTTDTLLPVCALPGVGMFHMIEFSNKLEVVSWCHRGRLSPVGAELAKQEFANFRLAPAPKPLRRRPFYWAAGIVTMGLAIYTLAVKLDLSLDNLSLHDVVIVR